MSAPLPIHSNALRVAIITENFLPKIDGVTITLAHLLEHLNARGVRTALFGPESGMAEYAGCQLFGTYGVPLRVYPGLKINFLSTAFLHALRQFRPDIIHLVDPIWLGVQSLAAIQILFPNVPVVTSHHTNLPTYATIFGYPYYHHRTWQINSYLHSFAKYTLVPSVSTAGLLEQKGFANLRVCHRGVDPKLFNPSMRSDALRASWGISDDDVVVLSVGRLSPEKNLSLLVDGFALLPPDIKRSVKLVFVGDGPFKTDLQQLCAARNIPAIFTGQLIGRALGEAFASADIMSSPSITETFGQVTLQGMASGLPIVGLYAEGTADLVTHLATGLLLDVHAAFPSPSPPSASPSSVPTSPTSSSFTPPSSPSSPSSPLASPADSATWSPTLPLSPSSPVACYYSCATLMRPTAPAFAVLAARYARLLEVLIADAPLRARMGAAALPTARTYSWERCTDRILDTYIEAYMGERSSAGSSLLERDAGGRSTDWRAGAGGALAIERTLSTGSGLPRILQNTVDFAVVVHSIVLATLSHASYMVPNTADLFGP